MTDSRALLLSVVAFVLFTAIMAAIFLPLDVEMILLLGPLAVVGICCAGIYRTAVRDRP